jgi:nickel-dependent lactate racemase
MKTVAFPYGKEKLSYTFGDELCAVLEPSINEYAPEADGAELVRRAMAAPIGSPSLSELAKGKRKVVIIASDHTRPVPSGLIIPPMLAEIRAAASR